MSRPKYIDPFSDTGFKAIFGKQGSSEEVIRHLLNALFTGQPGFDPIEKVQFINNERTREHEDDKTIIHDVMCTTEKGHRFIVEMQASYQRQFMGRAIYYVSRGVTDQARLGARSGEWKYDYAPVVGTFIAAHPIRELPEKVVTHGALSDLDSGKPIDLSVRYAFIQTSYFNKSEEECETEIDKLIYIIKNMATLNEIPFKERENDVYEQIDQLAQYASLSVGERDRYDYEIKLRRDRACELDTAFVEGETKVQKDVVKKMVSKGFDDETICDILNISAEKLRYLRQP